MVPDKHWILGERASPPASAAEVRALLRRAAARRAAAASLAPPQLFGLLRRLRQRWRDPDYPHRRALQDALPGASGVSAEAVHEGLRGLDWVLDPDRVEADVAAQTGGIPMRGPFSVIAPGRSALRWFPLGTVLHVLPGNSFLAAARAWVDGIATGNVNLLKPAASGTDFLDRLVDSVVECDESGAVSGATALLELPREALEVLTALKAGVDGVAVWGGADAVRAYRDGLPPTARLLIFGPKLSLALVTRRGAAEPALPRLAAALAADISAWDQASCASPQVCWVEGSAQARRLGEAMAEALERMSTALPEAPVPLEAAVEIQTLRAEAELAEARGEGLLRASRGDLRWTVVVESGQHLQASPLHRTLRIAPYERLAEPLAWIEERRGWVQSAAIACGSEERDGLCERLAEAGATRITAPGRMHWRRPGDPRDGSLVLPQLMRLASASFDGLIGPAG